MSLSLKDFYGILLSAVEQGVSDVFIGVEVPVYWRRYGLLSPLTEHIADSEDVLKIFTVVASKGQQGDFYQNKELDFTWEHQGYRYRIHIYYRLGTIAMALRVFPRSIPSLTDLGQAGRVKIFLPYTNGLLLVTGATGAGKTTTVAALLAEYNRSRAYHILTLEDPVEYLYPKGRCLFSQQELGRDFLDYRRGVISAMRENPDIIMLAELRDEGTCEAALSAAASGHYVIATMHTGGAVETVERFISMFASVRQGLARSMLASSLRGICSQQLVQVSDGPQHCVVEILHNNNAVGNIIRSGKYEQLTSVMQSGASQGMQTMEMGMKELGKA